MFKASLQKPKTKFLFFFLSPKVLHFSPKFTFKVSIPYRRILLSFLLMGLNIRLLFNLPFSEKEKENLGLFGFSFWACKIFSFPLKSTVASVLSKLESPTNFFNNYKALFPIDSNVRQFACKWSMSLKWYATCLSLPSN